MMILILELQIKKFYFLFYFNGETPYECAMDYSSTEIIDMIEDRMPDDLFDEYKNKKIFDNDFDE